MSDVRVYIEVDNRSVYETLDRMDTGFSATALTGFLIGVVGPYLQEKHKQRFASEGDNLSGKWHPLTEATKRIRASQGFDEGPINRRTGEMEAYVTGGVGAAIPVGPVAILTFPSPANQLDADLIEKLTTAGKGKAHPRTPPRPVLGMGAEDAMFMVASLSFYAQKVIDGKVMP